MPHALPIYIPSCQWPIPFPLSSVSFDPRREFVDYRRPCLAHDFDRASRTTDCADNHALVDQSNTASRRNDSIEREQIVEVHKLNRKTFVGRRKVTAARAPCSAISLA